MADRDGFGRDGLDRLGERLDQSGRMTAAFEAELSRLGQVMGQTGREVSSLTSGFGGGLRRAFEGVVFDGVKLSDALKSVAQSMADTVFAVAMRPVRSRAV